MFFHDLRKSTNNTYQSVVGSSLEPFLYIGLSLASLAFNENVPLVIVAFITLVRGFYKIPADLTTTLEGIKSFPVAFFRI